jgi:hypothetical protein
MPGMPVPPILVVALPVMQTPKGPIAPKFTNAELKCVGLADAYRTVCAEVGCHFFDAGSVVASSSIDGVHLDLEQHGILGHALAETVKSLL